MSIGVSDHDAPDRRRLVAASAGVLLEKSLQVSGEVHTAMLARGFRGEIRLLEVLIVLTVHALSRVVGHLFLRPRHRVLASVDHLALARTLAHGGLARVHLGLVLHQLVFGVELFVADVTFHGCHPPDGLRFRPW